LLQQKQNHDEKSDCTVKNTQTARFFGSKRRSIKKRIYIYIYTLNNISAIRFVFKRILIVQLKIEEISREVLTTKKNKV
jgi:hypothetical protein